MLLIARMFRLPLVLSQMMSSGPIPPAPKSTLPASSAWLMAAPPLKRCIETLTSPSPLFFAHDSTSLRSTTTCIGR